MLFKLLFKFMPFAATVLLLSTLTSCNLPMKIVMAKMQKKEIFTVSTDEKVIVLDGIINTPSLEHLKAITQKYPDIKTINIKNCDGSIDDEVNLQLGKYVYDQEMNTHLMNNGVVASGGTDFFLAGKKRTRGTNTKFGVHSWSDFDGIGKMVTAKDFPPEHEAHQPYIKYYESIGFTKEEASDFYFFTINLASAQDMHWMTEEEIKKYQMLQE